jgi:hypothetical protein
MPRSRTPAMPTSLLRVHIKLSLPYPASPGGSHPHWLNGREPPRDQNPGWARSMRKMLLLGRALVNLEPPCRVCRRLLSRDPPDGTACRHDGPPRRRLGEQECPSKPRSHAARAVWRPLHMPERRVLAGCGKLRPIAFPLPSAFTWVLTVTSPARAILAAGRCGVRCWCARARRLRGEPHRGQLHAGRARKPSR